MTASNLKAASGLGQEGPDLQDDNADLFQLQRPAADPDPKQAERFLQLLGKDPARTWFRTLKPVPGAKTKSNPSRKGADLQGFDLAALTLDNSNGANVYLVVGDASSASGLGVKDADIETIPALFVEWDDMPMQWQLTAWQTLNLPEPSLMVPSGGKSLHTYWLLDQPLPPDQWRALTARLIDYCNSDKECRNPSRVMRLPGFAYIDKKTGKPTGTIAEILHESDNRYSAAEIEACLPAVEQQTIPDPWTPTTRATTSSRTRDLPPRGIDQIRAAADCIPARVPGNKTYDKDRRALCGCAAALAEIGLPEEQALDLLASKWPSRAEAQQVLSSSTTRAAGSFWGIAAEHGFDLRHRPAYDPLDGFEVIGEDQGQQQRPPSFQSLIQLLPDGWAGDHNKATYLSAGRLADMLPAAALRFNEMTLRAEVHTASGWRVITDADLDSAYVVLSGKGWKIGSEPVIKAILHAARQAPHHPVRAYLQQVEADPTIAPFDLNEVAPRFFRASAPLHAAMVRAWLIGAASRALNPGCQMDYVLVLKGGQGQRKSRSLEALAFPDWYCSSIPESEKDQLLIVHSTWIYELAELESVTSRKESGRLKNLITTSVDNLRPPYGRTNERLPRQSVFCATVNEDTFLRDDTGNRRFWVVPVEGGDQLDKDGLLAARDGIWKAAVAAYRAGELPMLAPEMEQFSAQQNEEYNAQDPWAEMVRAWMEGDPLHRWDEDRDPSAMRYAPDLPFTSADVLYSAGLRRPDSITRADEMRVAAVLRQFGFIKGRQQRIEGRVARLWELSQPSQPSQPQSAEVVTPQNPCAAVDPEQLSQPSQPKSDKWIQEEEGGRGGSTRYRSAGGCPS